VPPIVYRMVVRLSAADLTEALNERSISAIELSDPLTMLHVGRVRADAGAGGAPIG